MDTQALSVVCSHMKEHSSCVVADLKKQLAAANRQNANLQKKIEGLERVLNETTESRLNSFAEIDRLRTHLSASCCFLRGISRQCDEYNRRLEAVKWFD